MNKELKFCVYKHTVIENGKCYIGITSQNPRYRWGIDGKKYKNCPFFYKAIQKYGWENIKHEIIATGLIKKEAEDMEVELISKNRSNEDKFGYNILIGGNLGTVGTTVSQETREKLRRFNLGKKNKPMPETTRRGIENARWKTKKKIAQIDIETNKVIKIWEGGIDIERAGIALNSNIIKCCRNKADSAGGFHWKYANERL